MDKITARQTTSKPQTLPKPTDKMLLAHRLTLIGYWGLVILIPLWNMVWYPSSTYSNSVITLIWLFPLIFPLFGLNKGKAYTHAWSGFIAVIYLCHGLASLVTHLNEYPAILFEIIFSSLFLFGGIYFAKWRGQQLGLQLPKRTK